LQATTPRFAIGSASEFYGVTSVEPFFDFANGSRDTFGDRFRINFGIGKLFGNHLRAEVNYLFHQIRIPEEGGSLDFDDHVLRVRFFYAFD